MLYVLILNCLFSKYYSTCFSIVNRFSAFILKKNVPRHILAPSAVACDILHLRASAHPAGGFCRIGDGVSYTTKKRSVRKTDRPNLRSYSNVFSSIDFRNTSVSPSDSRCSRQQIIAASLRTFGYNAPFCPIISNSCVSSSVRFIANAMRSNMSRPGLRSPETIC